MATNKKEKRRTAIEFTCPQCGTIVGVEQAGDVRACPACKLKVGKVVQLDQLLARWWEPRRWRADLVKPNVPYLVERLWTANGQGERLYTGVSRDPLAEDPQYVLTIVDSEKFAEGVEKLFPEVDWDEPVSAAVAEAVGLSAAAKRAKGKKKR